MEFYTILPRFVTVLLKYTYFMLFGAYLKLYGAYTLQLIRIKNTLNVQINNVYFGLFVGFYLQGIFKNNEE